MKLVLPLPSRLLTPNARIHYRVRAKLTKLHRERAKLETLALRKGKPKEYAGYSLAFHFPDARKRDLDNCEASCKAYRDGIADALKMNDFNLNMLALTTAQIDRENPRVEITLYPLIPQP